MKKLSKRQAAELLGCAERQIQRYTAQGKLTVEYVQDGKTRKALYSEADVLALKRQLDAPELRAVAVRTPQTSEATPHISDGTPQTTDHQQLTTTNPLALPPQAQQVLQMLGATSFAEAGKCVMVEEVKFDRLVVRADGTTRMAGVQVSRYSARA